MTTTTTAVAPRASPAAAASRAQESLRRARAELPAAADRAAKASEPASALRGLAECWSLTERAASDLACLEGQLRQLRGDLEQASRSMGPEWREAFAAKRKDLDCNLAMRAWQADGMRRLSRAYAQGFQEALLGHLLTGRPANY